MQDEIAWDPLRMQFCPAKAVLFSHTSPSSIQELSRPLRPHPHPSPCYCQNSSYPARYLLSVCTGRILCPPFTKHHLQPSLGLSHPLEPPGRSFHILSSLRQDRTRSPLLSAHTAFLHRRPPSPSASPRHGAMHPSLALPCLPTLSRPLSHDTHHRTIRLSPRPSTPKPSLAPSRALMSRPLPPAPPSPSTPFLSLSHMRYPRLPLSPSHVLPSSHFPVAVRPIPHSKPSIGQTRPRYAPSPVQAVSHPPQSHSPSRALFARALLPTLPHAVAFPSSR